jgi:hypothetical protein
MYIDHKPLLDQVVPHELRKTRLVCPIYVYWLLALYTSPLSSLSVGVAVT